MSWHWAYWRAWPLLVSDHSLAALIIWLVVSAECYSYAARIPNINRWIDNGEDLFTIWTPYWADNVSGAQSKQYQKHINVYTMNANLPGHLLQQEYFVCFVSTSQHAGALEQLKVVMEKVKYVPVCYLFIVLYLINCLTQSEPVPTNTHL